MAVCAGKSADHCCYIHGQPCRYLEEGTVKGRRWACGLRRILGSWEKVHKDAGYRKYVQPFWTRHRDRLGIADCGDWPPPGERCASCGVTGDG